MAQQGKKPMEISWIDDERKTDMVHTDCLVHTEHPGKKGRREDEQKLERLMSQGCAPGEKSDNYGLNEMKLEPGVVGNPAR